MAAAELSEACSTIISTLQKAPKVTASTSAPQLPPLSSVAATLMCQCLWQGISGADLNKELEKFNEDMRKTAINKMSRDGKLNIQKKDGAVWFHYKEDAGESARSVQSIRQHDLIACCRLSQLAMLRCSCQREKDCRDQAVSCIGDMPMLLAQMCMC